MIKSNQWEQVSSNTNTLIFAKSFKDMVTVIVSSFVFLLWLYSEPPVQWNDLALTFNNSFIDLLNQYNIKHKIKHREQRLVCLGNYRLFSSSGDFFFSYSVAVDAIQPGSLGSCRMICFLYKVPSFANAVPSNTSLLHRVLPPGERRHHWRYYCKLQRLLIVRPSFIQTVHY